MATDAMRHDPASAPQAVQLPPAAFSIPGDWTDWTFADLQAHLGEVPQGRIRLNPQPGTAT